MKHLSYIIAGFALCCMTFCTKERLSNPLSNYLTDYYCYRIERGFPTHPSWSDEYYFNSQGLMDFLPHYGQSSPNIWDFNGTGVVDASDMSDVVGNFGNVAVVPFDIYSAQVTGQFSSGWTLDIDGFQNNFAVLKVTPTDEVGGYFPEELHSFFIEGFIEGENVRYWFYEN